MINTANGLQEFESDLPKSRKVIKQLFLQVQEDLGNSGVAWWKTSCEHSLTFYVNLYVSIIHPAHPISLPCPNVNIFLIVVIQMYSLLQTSNSKAVHNFAGYCSKFRRLENCYQNEGRNFELRFGQSQDYHDVTTDNIPR